MKKVMDIRTSVIEADIDSVFARLSRFNSIAEEDRESILRVIRLCLENGFTTGETVRYCRCFEEVNPDLDECIALDRMAKIQREVNNRWNNV